MLLLPLLLSLAVGQDSPLDELEHLRKLPTTNVEGLPEGAKKMSFTPPQLSDEEERSPHLPVYLACDACLAVVTQVEAALESAHRHQGLDLMLKQYDVIGLLEDTCDYNTFQDYGITEHQGKHRLKGPGLDPTTGQGGVSHMGGKWPIRLEVTCLQIMGEFEDAELQLYRKWREGRDGKGPGLEKLLCRNEDSPELGRCLKPAEQPEVLVREEIEEMLRSTDAKTEEL